MKLDCESEANYNGVVFLCLWQAFLSNSLIPWG